MTFDEASKEILKGENIRAGIVKHHIDEYKDLSIKEIKGMLGEVEPSTDSIIPDSTIRYDVLFSARLPNSKDDIGIYIDLEPQGYYQREDQLINRAIYYGCRLIDRQRNSKPGFSSMDYQKLKKVYSVWIITDEKSAKKRKGEVVSFKINQEFTGEKGFDEVIFDKLRIILLYPYSEIDKNKNKILRLMSLFFSDEKTLFDRCDVLKLDYQIEANDKERKAMFGFLSVHDQEIKESLESEFLRGKNEGKLEGKIETFFKMINLTNLNINDVLVQMDFTEEEKETILERLNLK